METDPYHNVRLRPVQFLLYGWQSLHLTFLIPNVGFHCDTQNSTNATGLDACSTECGQINYDRHNFKESLTEKLHLVCDKSWLQSFSKTVFMFSGMFTNLIAGELSDRFGRRRTVLLCTAPYLAGVLLMLFTKNYAMLATGLVLVGMAYVVSANFTYLILYELSGKSQRGPMCISLEIGFTTGTIVLGVVAWWLRHWFWIQVFNLGLVAVLLLAWFLPESPDWLLTKGKTEEAVTTIKYIVRMNGGDATEAEIQAVVGDLALQHKNDHDTKESYSILDLFLLPKFRWKILSTCYFWFTASFGFFGLSLNVDIFGSDLYLSFILPAVATLPGAAILMGLIKVLQVKWMLLGYSLLASLACFIYPAGLGLSGFKTTIVVLDWFLANQILTILYIITSETFPTAVRGKATGLGIFMSRLGASLAPFVKDLVTND